MTSRLEDLFSPDRLRQNWEMKTAPVQVPIKMTSNFVIHTEYNELQRLIGEKFSEASRLSGRFDELTEGINQAFSLAIDSNPVNAEQKETIVGMLEQLEELLWAMELSQRS